MTILFVGRRSRKNRNAKHVTIYCRVKVEGIHANDFSTFIRFEGGVWDAEAQQAKIPEAYQNMPLDTIPAYVRGLHLDNTRLKTIENEIKTIALQAQLVNKVLTAQELADAYTLRHQPKPVQQKKQTPVTVLLDLYLKECRSKYRNDDTYQTYVKRVNNIKTFLKANQLTQKPMDRLTITHGEQFIRHMEGEKYDRNYIVRHVQVLRNVGSLAVIAGHCPINPFTELAYKKRERVNIDHLTLADLRFLETYDWRPPLQPVVDIFLFSCYTGLHYCDSQSLQPADVRIGIDGRTWLYKERGKYDDSDFFDSAIQTVPLHPKALLLITKYGTVDQLPKLSNKHYNDVLKQIRHVAGIRLNLTVKIARKTFTDVMLNELCVSLEAVAAMLGHAGTKHIRHYARTDERRVAREVHFPAEG